MNNHLIITTLESGLLRIVAEEGYYLWNDKTQQRYSEVIAPSVSGFRAILLPVPPEPHERTLDDAKAEKLAALKAFTADDKYFLVSNKPMWIGPDKRANLKNASEALKAQGVASVSYEGITIPTDTALSILSAIEAYAALHSLNEETHKAAINAKRAISTVDSYDFTTGYPEHLTFNLS